MKVVKQGPPPVLSSAIVGHLRTGAMSVAELVNRVYGHADINASPRWLECRRARAIKAVSRARKDLHALAPGKRIVIWRRDDNGVWMIDLVKDWDRGSPCAAGQ